MRVVAMLVKQIFHLGNGEKKNKGNGAVACVNALARLWRAEYRRQCGSSRIPGFLGDTAARARRLLGMTLVMGMTTGVSGCKSAFVEADVKNQTGGDVTLVEVDYPSAGFGKEALPAESTFHQRFKILGSGGTTVSWVDAGKKQHSVKGPDLHEGQDGTIVIVLSGDQAEWTLGLKH